MCAYPVLQDNLLFNSRDHDLSLKYSPNGTLSDSHTQKTSINTNYPDWFTPPISNFLTSSVQCIMILTKTLTYPNMLKYKSGQLYSIYKCVHIRYFEVFFFSCSVLWELVPPKLSTWKQCIAVYYPFPSEKEKNSQRDGQIKGPLALPIKKLATCNQKVSTFFLWAGVNST